MRRLYGRKNTSLKSWEMDENLSSLFSAAENTDKMAAAMLSTTLRQSVWLPLLVHL